MRTFSSFSLMLAISLLWTGCNRTESLSAPRAASIQNPTGKPQPKLATIKLWLGAQEIIAEQALSLPQIETGMMFRTEMAENEGMLFVFAEPHKASFWMKNTLLPLTCAYIDSEGKILEIHDMKPQDLSPIPAASDQIQYVLEMKQGWFSRNNVKAGTVVRTERGSLAETYLGRR
jgi:uncharacterized protein